MKQMFDILPASSEGNIDSERIRRASGMIDLSSVKNAPSETCFQRNRLMQKAKKSNHISALMRKRSEGRKNREIQEISQESLVREIASVDAQDSFLLDHLPALRAVDDSWGNFEKIMVADTYEKEWQNRGLQAKLILPMDTAGAYYQEEEEESINPVSIFSPIWRRIRARMLAMFILCLISVSAALLLHQGIKRWYTENLERVRSAGQYLEHARTAAFEGDISSAHDYFSSAYSLLKETEQNTRIFDSSLISAINVIPGIDKVLSARHTLRGGTYLAQAGEKLSEAGSNFQQLSISNILSGGDTGTPPPGEMLSRNLALIQSGFEDIERAEEEINAVDPSELPSSFRDKVIELKSALSEMRYTLIEANAILPVLSEFTGENGPRRYLILFQNIDEKRATGGFLGTYAILTITYDEVILSPVHNIYDLDGQQSVFIKSPDPLLEVASLWSMHDANWFFDFPSSARKISWFYEKSGGATVDGVLAFTPSFFERFLLLTGPIPMPEYGVTLSSENFIPIVQAEVETLAMQKKQKPKRILTDFAPRLIKKIAEFNEEEKKTILSLIQESLNRKDIQIYSAHPDIQKFLGVQGWSGEVRESEGDYLAIVHSNIRGYKTDRMMDEDIKLESEFRSDGSTLNTLSITRKHNGGNTPYEFWNKQSRDYLRVYVPEGSTLLDVTGHTPYIVQPLEKHIIPDSMVQEDQDLLSIWDTVQRDFKTGTEIFSEAGKTVYGNWVFINPGESVTVTYHYTTPPSRTLDSYRMFIQKQAGSNINSFRYTIRASQGKNLIDSTNNTASPSMTFSLFLDQDISIRIPHR